MQIPKLGRLSRTYRHAQRYRQILTALLKYGFNDLVIKLDVDRYVELGPWKTQVWHGGVDEAMSHAERVRRLLEELGPTFVKLGQILSTRPDLVPAEYLQELPKLQDRVPPFSFAEVESILREELGAPLEHFFRTFEPEPLAAASIGQVHRAERITGEPVVVKVQRPAIPRMVEVDLEILLHLAGLAERHLEGWKVHRPSRIVEEFTRSLMLELDYRNEAAHLERFAWQFSADRRVYVPAVHRDLTTARVLTLEYVDGIKASEIDRLRDAGLDPPDVAGRCADLTMKQIMLDGFFHADPHPGNVFILRGGVVCFLDFGQMGRIDRELREGFVDLIAAIVGRDEERVAGALLELTDWEEEPERSLLVRDLGVFIDRHFYQPLRQLKLGHLLNQLLEIAGRHRLGISPELFLMIKALSNVEGLCRGLDPDFDMTSRAAPFLKRVKLEQLRPGRLAADLGRSGSEFLGEVTALPEELRGSLRQLQQGRVRIGFKLLGLEPVVTTADRASNRLSYAIVLAALVIGSSLMVLAGVPPKWHEIPVIGLGGFVVAAVMGFGLLWSILKHGRM